LKIIFLTNLKILIMKKKLSLNKLTLINLNENEMYTIKGGDEAPTMGDQCTNSCPNNTCGGAACDGQVTAAGGGPDCNEPHTADAQCPVGESDYAKQCRSQQNATEGYCESVDPCNGGC
jgi:natural product precursor